MVTLIYTHSLVIDKHKGTVNYNIILTFSATVNVTIFGLVSRESNFRQLFLVANQIRLLFHTNEYRFDQGSP